MLPSANLRKNLSYTGLQPHEAAAIETNWWLIEQALNSVQAVTPGSSSPAPTLTVDPSTISHHLLADLTTFDDHPQYLYLAGRAGGQTINDLITISNTSGRIILQDPSAPSNKSFISGSAGGLPIIEIFTGSNVFTMGYGALSIGTGTISTSLTTSPVFSPTDTGSALLSNSSPNGSLALLGGTNGLTGNIAAIGRNHLITDAQAGFSYTPEAFSAVVYVNQFNVSGVSQVVRSVRGCSGQTGDLDRWLKSDGTILAKVDHLGNITALSFTGDGSGLTSVPIGAHNLLSVTHGDTLTASPVRGDILISNSTPKWSKLAIGSSGSFLRSNGTDPSWQAILETDITVGSLLARLSATQNITGAWTLTTGGFTVNGDTGGLLSYSASFNGANPSILHIVDSSTGNNVEISLDGQITVGGGVYIYFPAAGGTVLTTSATQNITNKTFLVGSNSARTSSSSSGFAFADNGTTSKILRLILSGLTASTNNTFTLVGTAARDWKTQDYTSSLVVVGNTSSSAGVLGKSDLTAQTGNIAAVTLLTSSSNSSGMFRISLKLKTTTAGNPGDKVVVNVAFNDGSSQSIDVPLIPHGTGTLTLNNSHDLGTLNASSFGETIVYAAASTAITFTTTVTKTGSPQYTIRARIEALN